MGVHVVPVGQCCTAFECVCATQAPVPDPPRQRGPLPPGLHLRCTLYRASLHSLISLRTRPSRRVWSYWPAEAMFYLSVYPWWLALSRSCGEFNKQLMHEHTEFSRCSLQSWESFIWPARYLQVPSLAVHSLSQICPNLKPT